jgi:ubiquinone/menaquinone biosynthesis C-methylase UbiE
MIYLLIILIIIYALLVFFKKEGFEQTSVYKTFINNIYDEFYTKIYDELLHLTPYDIEMIKLMQPYFISNSNLLCVGSKTGHIVQLLSKSINTTGVDKSYEMIKMSQFKYPKNKYVFGEYSSILFQPNTFTHILCPLFTINTVDSSFFQNANVWLVHQGYMGVMYFKDDFNIQTVRNHNPSHYFRLNYKYSITLQKNKITEKITNKKNQLRTNILYLNEFDIEEEAKNAGFSKLNEYPIPDIKGVYLILFQKF